MDTSNTAWANCHEDWERLRWARSRTGLTQEQFAESVGMKRTAYLKYEARPGGSTQHVPLRMEQARQWARKLRVSWEWLAEGTGTPWDEEKVYSADAKSIADLVDETPAAERPELVAAIKILLKRAG